MHELTAVTKSNDNTAQRAEQTPLVQIDLLDRASTSVVQQMKSVDNLTLPFLEIFEPKRPPGIETFPPEPTTEELNQEVDKLPLDEETKRVAKGLIEAINGPESMCLNDRLWEFTDKNGGDLDTLRRAVEVVNKILRDKTEGRPVQIFVRDDGRVKEVELGSDTSQTTPTTVDPRVAPDNEGVSPTRQERNDQVAPDNEGVSPTRQERNDQVAPDNEGVSPTRQERNDQVAPDNEGVSPTRQERNDQVAPDSLGVSTTRQERIDQVAPDSLDVSTTRQEKTIEYIAPTEPVEESDGRKLTDEEIAKMKEGGEYLKKLQEGGAFDRETLDD